MKYAYENLSPEQFETLVTLICQELLGISVQGFATGPDGGRDARFEGTAQLHPSVSEPWKDRVVIQAKHTNVLTSLSRCLSSTLQRARQASLPVRCRGSHH